MLRLSRRLGAVALLALAGALVLEGAASAHANYVRSSPASDARLLRPPAEVRVAFSEPPDPRGSVIEVLDASGKRVDRGLLRLTGEPNELATILSPIGDGGYVVAWTVLSTVDGHTTRGSFAFAVGDAPLPSLPDVGPAYAPPSPLEVAGRAISFAGIALALGGALFGLIVARPADPSAARRETILFAAAGTLVALGAGALFLEQAGRAPPRLATLLALRAGAGLAIIAGLRLGATPFRRGLVAADGLVAALTASLVSHAAATGGALEVALDFVHVIAVSAWLGGIVAFLVVVLPGSRASDAAGASALGRTVWRFSLLALVAVSTLVVTGVLQSLRRLVLVEDLVETPYGLALLAKVVLLVATVALGATNLLVWGPRLARAFQPLRTRRSLVRSTLGESALLAIVLVATALLTAFAPPAQPSGAAFDETRHVDGLRVQLLVPSTSPGRNRFVLRVHEGLRPVAAEKVALRFTMVEHDMGENELVLEPRAPGEYVTTGSTLAMFGTWRIEAIVRRADRDDVRTVFSVPVVSASGALARVLTAGPHTAIVFVDPAAPAAGAPLTIFVVVVDAKGDPVTGRDVRISLEGPVGFAPRPTAELGTGRYSLALDALDAGQWRISIAIDGTAASEPYVLEVAR